MGLGLLPPRRVHGRCRRDRDADRPGRRPAFRPRVAGRRVAADRLHDRAPHRAALARRRGDDPRRPLRPRDDAPQRPGGRRARARVRRQLRLRHHERGRPRADRPAPRRPGRQRHDRRRRALVPQRHADRRRPADRRRDVRRRLHGVPDRGERRPDRPPQLGPGAAATEARHAHGVPRSGRVRPGRLLPGRRGPHLGRGRRRHARLPHRAGRQDRPGAPGARGSRDLRVHARREDGRTLLCCAAPDFSEHARKQAREACLYTTTVDVPHGGRP